MNVAKYVKLWFDLKYLLQQGFAPEMFLLLFSYIHDAQRWSMSNQDVHFFEISPHVISMLPLITKGRSAMSNCMRRAEYLEAFDFNVLMLQVRTMLSENILELVR